VNADDRPTLRATIRAGISAMIQAVER
jgi:hypothetical protein